MKISVKVLQGQEIFLDVTQDMTIPDLKQKIKEFLKIPVPDQKLLVTGRPLLDTKKISDYPQVKDGTKLMLVVKRSIQETLPNTSGHGDVRILRDATYKFARQYFSEAQSQKVVDAFIKEFNKSISTLSLDDLERLSTSYWSEKDSPEGAEYAVND